MTDSSDGSTLKAAPKKRGKPLSQRLQYFIRCYSPERWSLKARFLYFTGLLLFMGMGFLIFFFSLALESTTRETAQERMRYMESWLQNELLHEEDFLLAQALTVSTIPVVKQSILTQDREALKEFILPFIDRIRLNTDHATLRMHFVLPTAESFLRSVNVNIWGDSLEQDMMVTRVLQEMSPLKGIAVDYSGPVLRAAVPITDGDDLLGALLVDCEVREMVSRLVIPPESGVIQTMEEEYQNVLDVGIETTTVGHWLILDQFGAGNQELANESLLDESGEGKAGKFFFATLPLHDFEGNRLGGLHMTFDAGPLYNSKWNRIFQLAWLFIAGAAMLWVFLYYNVTRVERFMNRLKKMVIASHSNDFGERFESDHVHCLDVMHCHNEECPVYKNPSLVCYLETGSEAISPKWRDTCVYLNKYDTCHSCPVYTLRRGDELAEMRNVVNTMMRLWSNFLSRTGHLLAYVLRSQEQTGHLPSLDEVSNRLEQMAKLTFFSHDLQGTLDKDEVYQQLAFVLHSTFGLGRFVLFEVDRDTNRIMIALDESKGEVLCKRELLLSAEICRCNRVAEPVISFYNPVLCPHFNSDLHNDVRCCLPIVTSGHVGAVVSFLAPKREWERLREVLPVIRKYLDEAAPVLSSLRLLKLSKEQALRDPLTHCHNRRFLDEFIAQYEPLSEREGRKAAFLMADVDYFKQVNDEFGHEAGDAVLQQVVRIIKDNLRRSDLVVRYGGEEFLILLQDVKDDMGEQVAEKIRSAVESHNFELPGGAKLHKTLCLGVAEYPEDGNTLYKTIKFADVALYAAKNSGRNRVVRFTPEMWDQEQY